MIARVRLLAGIVICLLFVSVGLEALRHRDRPGARSFAALCLLFTLFTAVMVSPARVVSVLWTVQFATFTVLTMVWLVFVIAYTGRGPALSGPLLLGLAGLALLQVAGVILPEAIPLGSLELLFAANFALQSIWYGVMCYGLLITGRAVFVYEDLRTGGTLTVTAVGLGTICIAVISLVEPSNQQTVLNSILFVLLATATVLLVTVSRYDVFVGGSSAGHLARERVLDEMAAAVVIVDRRDRVLDCNGAFESLFGVDRRSTIGRPLSTVVDSLSEGEEVELTTTDGSRLCDVDRTTLTAHGNAPIGDAYRIRDVTTRRTREQRLAVLNRVLRHNLRNDLDALHAFAETIESDPSAVDTDEIATRIGDTARELSEIGSTVERGERLLGRGQRTPSSVDVVSLASDVLDRYTSQYPGTGELSTPGSPTIQTDDELLDAVLAEIVENALEHGPGSDAHVEIVIEESPSGVRISVRDNGPGIPDRERGVLLDGEENPLRHGSGVGLWLVNWGLSRLGGDLAFRENEPTGSVVTLTVPDL